MWGSTMICPDLERKYLRNLVSVLNMYKHSHYNLKKKIDCKEIGRGLTHASQVLYSGVMCTCPPVSKCKIAVGCVGILGIWGRHFEHPQCLTLMDYPNADTQGYWHPQDDLVWPWRTLTSKGCSGIGCQGYWLPWGVLYKSPNDIYSTRCPGTDLQAYQKIVPRIWFTNGESRVYNWTMTLNPIGLRHIEL